MTQNSIDGTVMIGGELYETIDHAAARTQLSRTTVRKYIATGDLPAFRLGARKVRVKVADVDALLRPVPSAKSGL